jgi:hypothetical protein
MMPLGRKYYGKRKKGVREEYRHVARRGKISFSDRRKRKYETCQHMYICYNFFFRYLCLKWKRAIALSLGERGSAWGKGEREGSAPQETGKISSQYSAKAGTTWARMRKTNQVGCDGGLAGTE